MGCTGSPALPPPLDGNDSPPRRSASAAPNPRFEIEDFGLPAEPERQQEVRRQQRDVMAGGTIDLHDIAATKILDPCQVSASSTPIGRPHASSTVCGS
jgi:hypothetical protein